MATKAQWYRYNTERAEKQPKRPVKARRPAEQATGLAAPRNESRHAGRKAVYALEDAPRGSRPSRKSTRASSNRQKNDAQFRMKREMSEARPELRVPRRGRGGR